MLCQGLRTAGFDITDVQGVLVTHIHPDHYGLAGRIREASGAWVALHPADAALVHDRYEEPSPLVDRVGELLLRAGAPEEEVQSLKGASVPVLPFVVTTHPDVLLEDGDKLEVPGWNLVAIWTPGHTAGHLCFYERDLRLMLSGDHVLPRITPNISVNPQAENPLIDYLESLDKVGEFDTDEVLPAHEHRFVGLRRGRRRHQFGCRHGLGHHRTHAVVAVLGPHQRLDAPSRPRRSLGPHPRARVPRRRAHGGGDAGPLGSGVRP